MILLLDSCIWKPAKHVLEEFGHDVIHTGDWESDPGDEAILKIAFHEKRILITIDKDFGELIVLKGMPHKGLIRLINIPSKDQSHFILRVLNIFSEKLQEGVILTVSEKRIRQRPPK